MDGNSHGTIKSYNIWYYENTHIAIREVQYKVQPCSIEGKKPCLIFTQALKSVDVVIYTSVK